MDSNAIGSMNAVPIRSILSQAEPATLASLVGAFAPQAANGRLARNAQRALHPGTGSSAATCVLAPQTPPRLLTQDDLWPLWQASLLPTQFQSFAWCQVY